MKNPTDPIPCDSDAYTAAIAWNGNGAYTVTLTPTSGAASTLTGWQSGEQAAPCQLGARMTGGAGYIRERTK